MIKCKLILTAENVLRDADSDTISVFTIIEELSTPAFPTGINKMCCLFYLEREPSDDGKSAGVITFSLAGNEISSHQVKIDFQDKLTMRLIVKVIGVVLSSAGVLSINIKIGDNVLSTWSINVKQIQPAQLSITSA